MRKALFVIFCCVALLLVSCATTAKVPSKGETVKEAPVIDSWEALKAEIESTRKSAEFELKADLVADADVGTIVIPFGTTITIKDDGTARTISRGSLTAELFNVEDGGNLVLEASGEGTLVLDGQSMVASAAAIVSSGEVEATNVIFRNFASESDGGVVMMLLGYATFNGCTFDSNTANAGAGINTTSKAGCVLGVNGCTFSNNTVKTNGAALNMMNATNLTLKNSVFTGNKTTATAKNKGGAALYMAVTTSDIKGCTFTDNTVEGETDGSLTGAAILYYCVGSSDTLNTIDNCTFSGNGGVNYGGAIGVGDNGKTRNKSGVVKISNCAFNGNSADNGTGLASRFPLGMVSVTLYVTGCTFTDDDAWFTEKNNNLRWSENNIDPTYSN